LCISKILKPFRAAASWIRGGTELLMQQIDTTDDPKLDILQFDLLGASDRFC